jgi:hypothetical protein
MFLKFVFPHPAHSDDQIRQKIGQMIIVGFDGTTVPGSIRLKNYPNPFNPSTTLRVTFDRPTRATISLTNILGQEIARLEERNFQAGTFEYVWDARDRPSGVYFCTVRTESKVVTRSLLLVR